MAGWKSLTGAVGRAADYLTPGAGSNRLTDWSGWGDPVRQNGGASGSWESAYTPPASSVTQDSSMADWRKGIEDEMRRLTSSMAPTPKLAQFDVLGNYRQAQSAAERAQNPLYEQKLNQFLARNEAKRGQARGRFNLEAETIGMEKANTIEENQINRGRTAEDTQMAIEGINIAEGNYQGNEGREFDQQYRQAAEQIAASGMATSGLGRQQSSDAIRLRNVTNQQQLDAFNSQREAKQLFKERTFEDLARGDVNAEKLATSRTRAAQFDLDSAIEDLFWDEEVFKVENESERLKAVRSDAQNYQQLGIEQFLAGLQGSGMSAQDIAYNRQVYA
jgi:hypothetical protein